MWIVFHDKDKVFTPSSVYPLVLLTMCLVFPSFFFFFFFCLSAYDTVFPESNVAKIEFLRYKIYRDATYWRDIDF